MQVIAIYARASRDPEDKKDSAPTARLTAAPNWPKACSPARKSATFVDNNLSGAGRCKRPSKRILAAVRRARWPRWLPRAEPANAATRAHGTSSRHPHQSRHHQGPHRPGRHHRRRARQHHRGRIMAIIDAEEVGAHQARIWPRTSSWPSEGRPGEPAPYGYRNGHRWGQDGPHSSHRPLSEAAVVHRIAERLIAGHSGPWHLRRAGGETGCQPARAGSRWHLSRGCAR